jgi:hypothetical protein
MARSRQLTRLKQIARDTFQQLLERELNILQRRTCTGFELNVKWLPGRLQYHDGRSLAEEVKGDTIIIYTEDQEEAVELLYHGFFEWLMNRHTEPYLKLINKLIALFESLQYQKKEKTIEALVRLL